MRKELKIWYYLFIIFLLSILFYPLIYNNSHIVNYDSEMIIRPLLSVHSISDYFLLRSQNRIFDFAPVRDLSHLFDIQFLNLINSNFDILHNVILWVSLLFVIYLILREWRINSHIKFLLILLVSIHPALLQTIVWVSARKHILATFFLLIAIYFEFKNQRENNNQNRLAIFIFYLLSALSWPILILYPVYYLLFDYPLKRKPREQSILLLGLLISMLVILYFNLNFYHNQFVSMLGVEKTQPSFSMGLSLLGLGRAFIQTIFPFFLAMAYGPKSILNIFGLVLFPIVGYLFYLKLERKDFFKFLILYILPLLTVLTFPTAIFLMDTYVFFSAIIFWMYLIKAFEFYLSKYLKFTFIAWAILMCLFYYKDTTELKLRMNEKDYIEHSYQIDKNCVSTGIHLLQTWEAGNIAESISEFKDFSQLGCKKSNLQQIYLYTIFLDENFTLTEKKQILRQHAKSSFLASILYLGIEYKTNPWEVVKNLNSLFRNNVGKTVRLPFDKTSDPLITNLIGFCKNNTNVLANKTECDTFLLNLDKHFIKH